jgi:uncharacterized membrane protein
MIVIAAALAAAFLHPALAAEPGYFKVTGVAAGDVLNVRMEPDGKAEVMDTLAPGAGPLEVLEVIVKGSAEWGRVIGPDADGWIAMRFLEPVEVPAISNTLIPEGLACYGTEPFWNLSISSANGIKISTPDEPEASYKMQSAISAVGRNNRFSVIGGEGAARIAIVLARDAECSDGMSDRNYPWRADVLRELPGSADFPHAFEGCCYLPVAGK